MFKYQTKEWKKNSLQGKTIQLLCNKNATLTISINLIVYCIVRLRNNNILIVINLIYIIIWINQRSHVYT